MDIAPSRSGLSVLLGSIGSRGRLVQVPIDKVVRNESQPRERFDPAALAALAASIESQGIIQPIAVREAGDGRFEIIAGERRWLAARQAGLSEIPAVVHDADDRATLTMALAENLVRENLNAVETARAYAQLVDTYEMTVADLARAMGRSRPTVANTLRLLELPERVLEAVETGELSEGHGRALLQVSDRVVQQRLAREAIDKGWSVRALEAATRAYSELEPAQAVATTPDRPTGPLLDLGALRDAAHVLSESLPGVDVRVRNGKRGPRLEFVPRGQGAVDALASALERATLAPVAHTA